MTKREKRGDKEREAAWIKREKKRYARGIIQREKEREQKERKRERERERAHTTEIDIQIGGWGE